jgi:hypothetical protein
MIVKNKWIPGIASMISGMPIAAVTLGLWVFVKPEYADNKVLITHESIHVEQYKETLIVGFLLIYIVEFFCKFLYYWDWQLAYENLSFEREAYANEFDEGYLKTRKRFNWIKLIMGH